ncbi:M16 family metallopeptidase [Melioribacter sp. Ez-97]|uniref:M16 family metallopeptidase n=1 Tax=Melioribacter sp. Ez-97 TaxID=3423434 RepID=UPI003EDA8EF9
MATHNYLKNIKISRLDNGITVVSEKIDHVDSFSLGFWFNVGSRDENETNNGISHFIEHMFFKGTRKRNARKIAEDIESLGGYLNAFTSKEHTCYYGRGLKGNLEQTFEVLSDMLLNSVFSTKEIRKEAQVVIDELYDIEDSPEELIFDRFESAVFNGSSLGLPIIGTEKNIRNFTRKDIREYVRKNYTFNRMYIVASGNLSHNRLIKLAEKYIDDSFEKYSASERNLELNPAGDLFIEKDSQQVHYIAGTTTYGFNSKKRYAARLLSYVLGEGSSSRLFQRLREENGIAYQINTFLNSFYDVSTFGVYLSTNEKSIHKAQKLIFEEINKIRNRKISAKELERAKKYMIGNMMMSLENTTNRMTRMGQSVIYFGDIKSPAETVKEINKVDEDDIKEIANEIFGNNKLIRVLLSSKNLLMQRVA